MGKTMSDANTKYRGFFITEMVVALTILGILTIGMALSLYGFSRFNHYQLVRQRCTAAAQAQLDSLMVTGEPVSQQDFNRLWPGLVVSIEKLDGTAQWAGMQLVTVTTTGKSFRKEVQVRVSRYLLEHATTRRERR
ncbi:MAG: type II secretion system protein [Planctomycetota bacterium]|jgi:type II secretory pathway pseudopilin PulG